MFYIDGESLIVLNRLIRAYIQYAKAEKIKPAEKTE